MNYKTLISSMKACEVTPNTKIKILVPRGNFFKDKTYDVYDIETVGITGDNLITIRAKAGGSKLYE